MAATATRRVPVRPTKGERREARLVEVARELVVADSFHEASVSMIASAADVSRPTFYFYFASKDDLLARLVALTLDDIAGSLAGGLQDHSGSAEQRLREAIARGVDAWWEHRAIMTSALELAATDPAIYDQMMSAFEPVNVLCIDLVRRYGTAPESQSPRQAADLVLTLALMNERVIAHAIRSAKSRKALGPVEQRLLDVWVRAFGLVG